MSYKIQILGPAAPIPDEEIVAVVETYHEEWWIKEYDETIGLPSLVLTEKAEDALTFPNITFAERFYFSQKRGDDAFRSTDGLPNRPLRAFNVAFEYFEDA